MLVRRIYATPDHISVRQNFRLTVGIERHTAVFRLLLKCANNPQLQVMKTCSNLVISQTEERLTLELLVIVMSSHKGDSLSCPIILCSGEALEGKGRSGILPDMVNAGCCNDYFFSLQLDLVHTAWQDKNVPKEWADAVLACTHPKERRSWQVWQLVGYSPIGCSRKRGRKTGYSTWWRRSYLTPSVSLEVVESV